MYRTFNCGIGMVLAVAAEDAEGVIDMLNQQGETAMLIGRIEAAGEDEPKVIIEGQ
jgi:phosphoribosylformylglycinamidine cyclo-ligase